MHRSSSSTTTSAGSSSVLQESPSSSSGWEESDDPEERMFVALSTVINTCETPQRLQQRYVKDNLSFLFHHTYKTCMTKVSSRTLF